MRSRVFLSLLVLGLIVVLFNTACEKSNPPIDENKFIKVYSEMVFMQDTSLLSQKIIRRKSFRKV